MKNFEQIDHTADVALKIFGRSIHDFLRNAVAGLSSLLTDPGFVKMTDTRQIVLEADNLEDLLVDLLNELLFLFDTEQFISAGLNILEYRDFSLTAELEGERYDPSGHHILNMVKAATYHNLTVKQSDTGLEALVILDT